ncbi:hypothetical protein LOTGIDRAFT_235960 [Lottia gigantea]|uniref:Uncharacterized protein n=1 Tax=Lottia gigantea TaxID=225164 RepID=V3ZLD7_LOTGI|nr:hypothetical protein LOTGIDRAFT_235960 [Lottia gigantea]ESO85107.1 hypothetical protein LOTGIDRAFT_235960 [Lottia gigantea]
MHFTQIYGCVFSILVLECVWAAPVAEKINPAMKKRSSSDILDQEKQLKSLLSLAGNNIPMPNVAVQKSHVAHVETVNGQEVKHEAIEEKVTDTQTGAVVSDIKQDVTENDATGGAEPQKVVKTKVDIPAEGIHKTIVQNAQKSEVDESLALTPTDVAQYLLETGEFQNFYSAIQDLINSNVMTQEEAEAYQQEVMNEYQRLLAEIDAYQAELAQQEEALPVYYPPPFPGQVPQKKSDLYAYQGGFLPEDLSPQNQQAIQEALLNNEKSLNEAIDSLLEAWWNQAFEAGDSRAQALVEYLYNIVSKDDDLDDMGQIKEIVAKMLARAVMEDLSVESQPELLENVVGSESSQESEESDESAEEEAPQQSSSEEDSEEGDESDDKTEESESQEESNEEVSSEEVVPPEIALVYTSHDRFCLEFKHKTRY